MTDESKEMKTSHPFTKHPLALSALLVSFSLAAAQDASRFHNVRQIPLTTFEKSEASPASVAAPLVKTAPVLDGVLDDDCWKRSGIAAPFLKCDDSIPIDIPGDVPTEVLVCRDAANLYLGWKLTGEPARKQAERFKAGGAHNHRLPRALAILQPIGADNWYGFYFNPGGGCSSRSQREAFKYEAKFTIAGKPVKDGAVIELAIPFKNPGLHVPKENEWWRFQLGRIDNHEWTAWSNSRGTQEIPARYGYIFFGSVDAFEKTPAPVAPKVEFYGESRRYFAGENTTQFIAFLQGIPVEGRQMRFELFGLKGKKRSPVDRLDVADLKHPKVALLYDLKGLAAGDYEMIASVPGRPGKTLRTGRWAFSITDQKEKVTPFPEEGVEIRAHDQTHMPNGAWPISTGVPMPFGNVYDVKQLGLFENGNRIPANLVPRATWLPSTGLDVPEEKTDNGGIRWLGLSFVARYDNGIPRGYVLKKVATDVPQPKSSLSVSDGKTSILIKTGPAQLSISKSSFDGIHGAWLDLNRNGRFETNEQLILAGGGPYIIDEMDKRYDARHRTKSGNTNVVVSIEEQGPARVVVAAKGWYHTSKGEPLCIYHTRIIAFAGLPFFRVRHRTIVTYDTQTNKLADSAFVLPAPPPTWAYFGADNGQQRVKIQRDAVHWSSSLHQDRHNHFRMIYDSMGMQDGKRAVVTEIGKEGNRSDGSIHLYTSRDYRGVFVTLRDVWQKFPKELEVNSKGIAVHFWPLHGEDTFSDQEELERRNIHKLKWAHEGKYLDLQIPSKYRERLHEICKTDWFALRESVEVGYGSNGVGTAISNEFVVHLNDPNAEVQSPTPALVQQDPHALPDPAYACATNALEKIHHKDEVRFAQLERLVEKGYLAMTRFFSNTNEWGMWNYADLHTYPKPHYGYPNLHRVWLASHYRNVQTAWLMYFRSGSPGWLAWARAYSDHFMNVDTCHYDDPENPIIGTDPEGKRTLGYVIKMAGAMMHCKGFAHWTSDLNVATHNIDPDAFLWNYYIMGDYAAKDTYELWAGAFDRVSVPYAADRETNNSLGALLALYKHSWDPQLLIHIHRMGDVLAGVPFASHGSGCMWNVFWLDRYYRLTRDDRMLERAKEFLAPGRDSPRNGPAYSSFTSLCYEQTGDTSYVSATVGSNYKTAHGIYLNPDDPYDGWPILRYLATSNFAYTAFPRWMRSMVDAGIPFKLDKETCFVPYGGPRFKDPAGVQSNVEILFLRGKEQKQPLALEFRTRHGASLRLFDAEDKKVGDTKINGGTFYGEKALKFGNPEKQKAGLLRLTGNVYRFPLIMPITSFSGEAAVLRPGGGYSIGGMFYYLAPPTGYEGKVFVQVGGPTQYGGQGPTLVKLTNGNGESLLDSSVSGDMKRHTVRVTFDSKENPPPWKLMVAANVSLRFSGPDKLYAAPSLAHLENILKSLPRQTGP